MQQIVRLPFAVLSNVYVGWRVLFAELAWLAGPDRAYRSKKRKRAALIAGCRKKLQAGNDMMLQAQISVQEAEQAADNVRFAHARAEHLERLRRNCGLTDTHPA